MKQNVNFRIALIPVLLSFLFLTACGGGGDDVSENEDNGVDVATNDPDMLAPASCSINDQNQFVYDIMQEFYLYYDQLPDIDPSNYSSPRTLLNDLRVAPDRFSFIADQQAQQSFYEEGTFEGIGFSYQNNGNSFTVISVFDDSPGGRAGLKRSDVILSIDGVSISQINNTGGLNVFLSTYNQDDSAILSVSSAGATAVDKEVNVGLVTMNTVLKTTILTKDDFTVGYLALSSFIEPTKAELATAFKTFKERDVNEFVLDLRYNGGGRIDTAQLLASYLAGADAVGADAAKLTFNDKNTDFNQSYPFLKLDDSLNLKRLYVLTLGGTCSASELVINAMNPVGIEVITIGQTTCGKPAGFPNIPFCDKVIAPLAFNIVNDINQGDYFDGISATCAANDDTSKDFADPSEGMLSAALYHIENDQCQAANRSSKHLAKPNSDNKNPANIMQSVF